MAEEQTFALLLGEAAIAIWGDMPRYIQDALFETAMRNKAELRHASECRNWNTCESMMRWIAEVLCGGGTPISAKTTGLTAPPVLRQPELRL